MVQLQDLQGSLEIGLRPRQLHLDGPQTVDVRGGQVHSQQRQINLQRGNTTVNTDLSPCESGSEQGLVKKTSKKYW